VVGRFTRDDVVATYGDACFYCDGPFESLDHYVPIAAGGHHAVYNVRPSCMGCNWSKGTTTGEAFEAKAKNAPHSTRE
jgi:5-methylcytosine-specific restriction endonuclease McrA